MAISRKGSRNIVVDGKKYRWKVSKNGVLHLVVFREEEGVELKIIVNYPHGENKYVKPSEVKQFILLAIKDGLSLTNPSVTYQAS